MSPPTTGQVFAALAALTGAGPPEVPSDQQALTVAYHDLIETALTAGSTWRQVAAAAGYTSPKVFKAGHTKVRQAVRRIRLAAGAL